MRCRLCECKDFYEYLDLGFTPPADQFRRKEQLNYPEISYPLKVLMCEGCGLSQLNHVVSPEILYRNDYPYESSITKTGDKHWDKFAKNLVKLYKLKKSDLVVDIGSNVGTLLSKFKKYGTQVCGVDPAANIVLLAQKNGIDTIPEFFNTKSVSLIKKKFKKAKLITCTNCFAHIDDLKNLMKDVISLLSEDGVFVFESPHIMNLLKKLEYDTIYHEHLSYLSLKPLIPFFKEFDLDVINVEEQDIHGGSFRVHVSRSNQYPLNNSVRILLKKEISNRIFDKNYLMNFQQKVIENKIQILLLLSNLKKQGKRVVGVSAPAKGMTLLNYCGVDKHIFDYITEKSTLKIGRYSPGGCIPIVSDEQLLKDKPDYALILAWNFSDEIMKNLKKFKTNGGKFIIPIPKPKII